MYQEERDDTSLIQRLQQPPGLSEEFARLRPFIRKRVAAQIDRRILSRLDPSDIIQETFLLAHARLSGFIRTRPMPFRSWLRLLAKQLVITAHRRHLRSQKRTVNRENHDSPSELFRERLPAQSDEPAELARAREESEQLIDLIRMLSNPDQVILTLRDIEEKSNIEAAEILGISPLAASKRHSRALQRLRDVALSYEEA